MIASHSSSFMRTSRLSRVMPALLTRIAIGAVPRFDVAQRRFDARRASRTSSRNARRRRCRPRADTPVIDAAPSSVVAVPTTSAPALRERERDRAPDAARRAGDERDLAVERRAVLIADALQLRVSCASAPALVERCAVGQRERRSASASMRRVSPASTLPGPAFDDVRDAARGQRLDGLGPAHRARRLLRERGADLVGRRVRLRRRRCERPESPARESRPARAAPRAARPRASAASCGTAPTPAAAAALRAARLRSDDRALDRSLVAGDHDLARRVEIHGLDDLALRRFAACVARPRRRRAPMIGGHRAHARRHGLLHRLARESAPAARRP